MAFLDAPEYEENHNNLLRKLIRVTKGIMQGKTNNVGTFTLTANSTTTLVTLAKGRIGQETYPHLMALTSNAAAAYTNLYLAGRDVQASTLIFSHANTATTDRTYGYILTG